MQRLPVAGPSITEREIAYVTDAVTHGWYADAGRWTERFERSFAEYVGARHAVALPSCTAALHLSLAALHIGPGDEVLVPECTWIATAAPVAYVGATPVFVDIDPRSWCLDPAAVARALSPRTRAVIAVDLYGATPDWDALRAVVAGTGVALIEDAAEAVGARWKGALAGSLGDVGCFSFHGSKTLTTGEGGMLVTDREDLVERVRVLRDHGRGPGDRWFYNREVGFKYRMSAMQAALGCAQLERVDELVGRKREIFRWYREELSDVWGVTLNPSPPGLDNAYWMTTALFDPSTGLDKETVLAALAADGIDARPFFYPLSALPAYQDHPNARGARERSPVAYELSARGVNLPSALSLTRADVARVGHSLRALLRERAPAVRSGRETRLYELAPSRQSA